MGKLGWQYGTGSKSHGTVTNWCTRREWPVNCMTVISARWWSNMPFQRQRKCIFRWPVMGRYLVGIELLYNSVHRKYREFWRSDQLEIRCNRENQHSERPGPQLSSLGERERNADGHKSGGQYVAVLIGLQLPLTHNLSIKWEVYFSKNCVAHLYYCVVVMILHVCICVCIVGHGYTTVWPILYTSIHLVIYSILAQPSVDPFYTSTHTSLSWHILYQVFMYTKPPKK